MRITNRNPNSDTITADGAKRLTRTASSEAGLTLVEIMVVLIIIGVMWVAFGKRIFGAGDRMKAQVTESSLTNVKGYVEQFQLRYNKLPSSLDDLTRCTEATGPGCIPLASADTLVDAWGQPLRYSSSGRQYKIWSLGADMTEGGDGVNFDKAIEGP